MADTRCWMCHGRGQAPIRTFANGRTHKYCVSCASPWCRCGKRKTVNREKCLACLHDETRGGTKWLDLPPHVPKEQPMAGRGPLPKDPKLRKRTNRPAENKRLATADAAKKNKVPAMPKRPGGKPWSAAVREWWKTVWQSPMALQWLDADISGCLHDLLILRQFAHEAKTATALLPLLAAIRLQEARLGLSPTDRQRLRWEVPTGDEAEARPQNPPQAGRPWSPPVGTDDAGEEAEEVQAPTDPRSALQVTDGGMARKKKGA